MSSKAARRQRSFKMREDYRKRQAERIVCSCGSVLREGGRDWPGAVSTKTQVLCFCGKLTLF